MGTNKGQRKHSLCCTWWSMLELQKFIKTSTGIEEKKKFILKVRYFFQVKAALSYFRDWLYEGLKKYKVIIFTVMNCNALKKHNQVKIRSSIYSHTINLIRLPGLGNSTICSGQRTDDLVGLYSFKNFNSASTYNLCCIFQSFMH